MEFKSLQDLIRYVDSAFALKFYSGASVLRKGVLKVLANVIGGALYMISLLCRHIWKNRFVTTCDVDQLDGFGVEYDLPHKAPTYARGNVRVTLSTGSSTATVPAGTYLVDPLTNLEYRTLLSTSITASSREIVVTAVNPGASFNADAGTALQWRDSTPTGLEDDSEVVGDGLHGGYSVAVSIDGIVQEWGESAEEYRARLLDRLRNPPQGGCANDYKQWAERFDFVSKAFVIPNQPHAGGVCVVLANFNTPEIELNAGDVQKVEDYILADSRRVVTADVRVFSATVADFAISSVLAPNNEEARESVSAAVDSFFAKMNPGTTALFDDMCDFVRSNSLATTFRINSITKDGVSASNFTLDLDADNEVGEVGKATVNFTSAE